MTLHIKIVVLIACGFHVHIIKFENHPPLQNLVCYFFTALQNAILPNINSNHLKILNCTLFKIRKRLNRWEYVIVLNTIHAIVLDTFHVIFYNIFFRYNCLHLVVPIIVDEYTCVVF